MKIYEYDIIVGFIILGEHEKDTLLSKGHTPEQGAPF